ncbi:hypothetical protein GCK32_010564 [Trichostrongylus colubriformis]|uniref:Secreted protein n=1 Tax=Trichostrongylus colubriformis TaxID=6319 RepID=A0AAN8EZM5_TRICO
MYLFHFLCLALVIALHNGVVSSAPAEEPYEPDPEAIDQLSLLLGTPAPEEEEYTGPTVEEPLIEKTDYRHLN